MDNAVIKRHQEQLIGKAQGNYKGEESLSERVIQAFYSTPRHRFVKKYRNYGVPEWHTVTTANVAEHISTLYADHPLCLYGTDEDFDAKSGTKRVSTISQPSFVLRLIDLLKLRPGDRVFELGTASGWNAALMATLVGEGGHVYTAEIIPELAEQARANLAEMGHDNVSVLCCDAADGHPEGAPYDRVMFTAGAFDLPQSFHDQVKVGGLLLFVLKNKGGADNLILLEKHSSHFERIYSLPCGFVPMTGRCHVPDMEEQKLAEVLAANEIEEQAVSEEPFWWGSGSGKYFVWQTAGFRSFLSLSESYVPILGLEGSFGWLDPASRSFALAQPGKIQSFGSNVASTKLIAALQGWVAKGMPVLSSLSLQVYSNSDVDDLTTLQNENNWVQSRTDSTFVWSVP